MSENEKKTFLMLSKEIVDEYSENEYSTEKEAREAVEDDHDEPVYILEIVGEYDFPTNRLKRVK